MEKIIPVLLAGGVGTRLWPLSRKSFPKQFIDFWGNNTLFQQSALRLTSSGEIIFSNHITVTNTKYRFIVTEQLQKVGIDPGPIIIEPETKNTAPAILLAALYAEANYKDAVLIVAPTDHFIPNNKEFHNAISLGQKEVLNGKIVTFGISPTKPETGYGYISVSKKLQHKAMEVDKFIEKPDIKRAASMIKEGTYFWNAGIFLFKASHMIELFKKFQPDTLNIVTNALDLAQLDLGFLRINSNLWSKLKNVSIDYGIMEKTKNLVVVPFSSKWSDLGSWDKVWSDSKKDKLGNTTFNGSHLIDCTDTFLKSNSPTQQIVGLGLKNVMAIATEDAVLVAHKDSVKDVKKAVDLLLSKNISQAEDFSKDHRPWGWFEILAHGDHFKVKRIFVKPGASISLQSHSHRSEHWVVVNGSAKITIDDQIKIISQGQSIFVPKHAVHRIENQDNISLIIVEIQIGTYLEEDDIVRYEDLYGRN